MVIHKVVLNINEISKKNVRPRLDSSFRVSTVTARVSRFFSLLGIEQKFYFCCGSSLNSSWL